MSFATDHSSAPATQHQPRHTRPSALPLQRRLGLAAVLVSSLISLPSLAQTAPASPARPASAAAGTPASAPSSPEPGARRWQGGPPDGADHHRDAHRREDRREDHRGRHGYRGPGDDRAEGDPVERTQLRLAHLKIDLKITPAQDKAWQAYVAQATQLVQARKTRQASEGQPVSREALDTMNAPDREAWFLAQHKQALADREQMNKALKTLYSSLSPEQQALADRYAQAHHGRGGRGHHGR